MRIRPFPKPPATASRESTLPAAVLVVISFALYWLLPGHFRPVPAMVMIVLVVILIALLLVFVPSRHAAVARWQRALVMFVIAAITISNAYDLVRLIEALLSKNQPMTGRELILSAAVIWLSNVIVFGLWYWELDSGGPHARAAVRDDPGLSRLPDFQFPQLENPRLAPAHWRPQLLDYVYFSFTNGSAFSPTDVMPLTHWAKVLMAIQSGSSFLLIVLVTARAVNVL